VPDFLPRLPERPKEVVPDFVPTELVPEEFKKKRVQEDGGLKSFLLQRSVQTQCHFYRLNKKTTQARWLSKNSNIPEQLHGIKGVPAEDWRNWLLLLMRKPNENITVTSEAMTARGLSPGNPMYKLVPLWEYTFELDPQEEAEEIMIIAENLAEEWIEYLKRYKARTSEFWDEWGAEVLRNDTDFLSKASVNDFDPWAGDDTPYAAGNCDLLEALATRQAVISALTMMKKDDEVAYRLLNDYCEENYNYFQGELKYHTADTFLFGLLRRPWVMSGKEVVEPRSVCEQILELRESVAEDWIERLGNQTEEFLAVKREHFEQKLKAS